MICIARTFGAPETVPAGNVARSRSNGETPSRSSPATSETRWVTCENRSGCRKRSTRTVPGHADAREVVAAEVDEHHVLGAILLGGEQPLGVALAARGRAGDRVEARPASLRLHVRLGRRADEREVAELEQEQIRRRVDAPQGAVDGERRRRRRPLGPLREHDLERVAAADVLLRLLDAALVLGAAREAHRLAAARRRLGGRLDRLGEERGDRRRGRRGAPRRCRSRDRSAGTGRRR